MIVTATIAGITQPLPEVELLKPFAVPQKVDRLSTEGAEPLQLEDQFIQQGTYRTLIPPGRLFIVWEHEGQYHLALFR